MCSEFTTLSRSINWLSKFERSIGRLERRSISVLEIAIRWLSECERSIGVLRMATNWLSDCESGGLSMCPDRLVCTRASCLDISHLNRAAM